MAAVPVTITSEESKSPLSPRLEGEAFVTQSMALDDEINDDQPGAAPISSSAIQHCKETKKSDESNAKRNDNSYMSYRSSSSSSSSSLTNNLFAQINNLPTPPVRIFSESKAERKVAFA